MAERSSNSERATRVVVAVVASAAIVLVMWLGRRPAAPEPVPGKTPIAAAQVGVMPAAVDPARRGGAVELAAELPEATALPSPPEVMPVERARAREGTPVQIPVDPQLVAAAAARDAAIGPATQALQSALEDRQSVIASACWKGGGSPTQVFVQANFGASGTLISHQVADDGKAPAGLRACVDRQPLSLTIPGPGTEVTVRGILSFP